jgi:hypothetical protein
MELDLHCGSGEMAPRFLSLRIHRFLGSPARIVVAIVAVGNVATAKS